ncbi:(d)CMP kinase [Methylovorus sp. MP688]|jgi:CMP/dCMP kinase|uniref:(d)CMP kinase n=1 Tax=Methylovorus sp. (strain MP688) TaxID=887061 RepID=UPI0001EC4611|nr:(d)CMP kinase [Methylovorus sp. MP688]ADQ84325.1 cytidylate kinase [Methylovorus sp. MP688]
MTIPVIAIDGPSASGKGTVAQRVADKLGFHYLDSGALYRIVAYAGKQYNIAWNQGETLAEMAAKLEIRFEDGQIYLNGNIITEEVRSEEISRGASEVAVHPAVRTALLALQHSFRQAPGLVADGRDMATVVFPDAIAKVYLTASAEVRAERRYKQLMEKEIHANLQDILQDLRNRDTRDQQRATAPLQKTDDAMLLVTDQLSIDQAVEKVLQHYRQASQHLTPQA